MRAPSAPHQKSVSASERGSVPGRRATTRPCALGCRPPSAGQGRIPRSSDAFEAPPVGGVFRRVSPIARFVGCLCSSDFAVARIERQHIEPWTFSAMLRPFDVHSSPCHTGTVGIVWARPHHAEVEPSVEDSWPTRIGCKCRLFRAPPRRRDNADEPISSARPQEGRRPPRRMVS